jgi:acetyl esterase/lipase
MTNKTWTLMILCVTACGGGSAGTAPDSGVPDSASPDGAGGGSDGSVAGGGESVDIVTSCTIPDLNPTTGFQLATNIAYNSIASSFNLLDVAWPASGGNHPMVVCIHGGGMAYGGKGDCRGTIQFLASQGYTAAAINYRLDTATQAGFPMEVQDVRCAIRFLHANAAMWGGDPTRFGVLGTSAGGLHSNMIATAAAATELDGPCPSASADVSATAVLTYFGPADLRSLSYFGTAPTGGFPNGGGQQAVTWYLGADPATIPTTAALASPVVHASADAPPMLLIHGTNDGVVLLSNSQELQSAVRAAGVPATLLQMPLGHGFAAFSTNPELETSTCTALAFLKKWLKP